MNELQLFNFEGNNVEVFEYAGEILFNPKDVGKCLDMAESTIKDHARKMNKNQIEMKKQVHIMHPIDS